MRVLVTGAAGFIGVQVVAALTAAGHEVVRGVRRKSAITRFRHLKITPCDFANDTRLEDWVPRLAGIEAVVNCVGILRESKTQLFDSVHRATPCALFAACEKVGVRKVVQISALGVPEDTAFVRSKHEADTYLASLDLDWTILRPSVVYTPAGSYGGTSLLRAMAALPGLLFVPGTGQQRLQPVCGDDLARTVVQLLEVDRGKQQILEAVGPQTLSLADYLSAWRRWLGFSEARLLKVPLVLVRAVVWFGERFGHGPLGETMFRMLASDNVGTPTAYDQLSAAIGFRPRALGDVLDSSPSHEQDRWHARLYFLKPALRMTLALLWVASGVVGFLTPTKTSAALLASAGVSAGLAAPVVYTGSCLDLVLGVALFLRFRAVFTGGLMVATLLGYTVFVGLMLPSIWLEPFGGLIKNIPLFAAILVMMVLERER